MATRAGEATRGVAESIKIRLRKPGDSYGADVTIVRDMSVDQVTSYLRGILNATPVSIAGLPLHPILLCQDLRNGGDYEVLLEGSSGLPSARFLGAPEAGRPVGGKEGRMMQRLVNSKTLDRYRLITKGPSMEDAALAGLDDDPVSPVQRMSSLRVDDVVGATKANLASRKTRTPKEVILELQRGNGRFWMGFSERPELNAMERRALIIAQAPSVCIVGCADSRVPVEIVFDQGLGDIFVVRVAGNVVDSAAHGSIEYAVKHLDVKVVMVLGHEGCGAVRGAMSMTPEALKAEPAHLQSLLRVIKGNLPLAQIEQISDHRARDREAVVVNCTKQMQILLGNPVFSNRVDNGTLIVCGAFYEITSGIVDFFSLDKNGLVTDL